MIAPGHIMRSCNDKNVEFDLIDPLLGKTWDLNVTKHRHHTVFHRSAWARVLAETYGHRPFYLRAFVNGAETAMLPLMEVRSPVTGVRGVSLPFSDSAGPLWSDPSNGEIVNRCLLSLARDRSWHHLEIRGGTPAGSATSVYRGYESHRLDLRPGHQKLPQGFDQNARRSIRKAEDSGLNVRVGNQAQDMEMFYELHVQTRQRHGLPPQPRAFFDSITRNLIESGMGYVVLALHDRRAVAGAVFLCSGDRATFKFGASDKRYWSARPNHLVIWNAIRFLALCRYKELDFGRTSPVDTGLSRFKKSWGATSGTLEYRRYHVGKQTWITAARPARETHPHVFGHLPLAVNRLAGRLIYPHLD